jgi:hypothetical protein
MKLLIKGGPDDPKPKKTVKVKAPPYDFDAEMKGAYMKPLRYDNNRPARDVVLSAAQKSGIDPSFLMASAYQEGLGKAILKPDEVSEAYENARAKGVDLKDYPVDGFYNYGVDTFGNNYAQLKRYLPEKFEERFRLYDAKNEKGESVKTAAFKTNEDGLIAKSAFMKMEMDNLSNYAKQKGIQLDDKAKKYFTMAAFNAGPGNAKIMIDEYAKAKDKNKFIDEGQTTRGGVHKNVSPRLKRMALAAQLLGMTQANPQTISTQ